MQLFFEHQIKVSIIVPVYNAYNRIERCLDTLVNQTLRDIEIICVLDCPTGGTVHVVKELRHVIVESKYLRMIETCIFRPAVIGDCQ